MKGTEKDRSQVNYQYIVQNLSISCICYKTITDKKGKLIDFEFTATNPRFEELTGIKRKDIIGKKFTRVIASIEKQKLPLINFLHKIALSPKKEIIEQYIESVNLWLRVQVLPLEKETFLVLLIDISHRKQAEKSLKEREYILNERVKELTCLYGITALMQKGEMSTNEICNGIIKLIPSAMQYPAITCVRIVIDNQEYKTKNFNKTSWKLAGKIKIRNRPVGVLEVYYLKSSPKCDIGPFFIEEVKLINVIAERLGLIIERKRYEEQLTMREEKYRTLIENVNVGVYRNTAEPQGRFLEANPAMVRIFGYKSSEEVMQHSVADLYENPQDRKMFLDKIKKKGIVKNEELRLKKKNGIPIIASVTASAHRDSSGKIEWFDGVIDDITEWKKDEDALKSLSSRNQAILSAVPDIIMEVDNNKVYTWANQAGYDFFGKDVIGKQASFYFEEEQKTYDIVQPLFKGREDIIYVESWQRRKDGKKRLLAWWCRTLKDLHGNVTGALSTARDITDRKRAEQALRESELRYRTLIDMSPYGIAAHSEGKIIFVNPAAVRLMRAKNLEELIGKPAIEIVHPDYREIAKKRVMRMLKQGRAMPTAEEKFICFDGSVIDVEVSAKPFIYNNKPAVMIVASDITERKRTEEILRESEEKYRSLIQDIDIGVWRVTADLNGKILEANPAMARIFGFSSPEELKQYRPIDLYQIPTDRKAFLERVSKFESSKARELHFRKKDGTPIIVSVTASAHKDEHGKIEWIDGVIEDITERKKAEQSLRESEEKHRSLVQNVNIGVYRNTPGPQGKFIEVNPAMCRIFGYSSPEELKNITVSSLYQNSQERKTFLKQIVENNLAKDFELQLKKKDGTPIIASVTASAHRDIKGKIDWIDGVIEDVTERKKAEQKLRSEYDKFQGMLSAMEQGVDIVNKNYIIEFQNNLLKERFGDKQGEKCYVVYMGLKKPCNICMIHKAIGIGKTTRVELVGADGRNYEVNSSPFTDVDGEVKVIELVRDITEHKRAENILRESEEKYRGLVKNVDIGVFRTPAEPQGFFLEVNPAMARIFGYKSSEELMQHSVNDIYENPRARKIVLDKIKKNGFFKNEELRFKKKDGAIIIVSSTAAVHRDKKGKIDWIDGVIEDITERKHAEEELRKHRLHLEEMVQERTKQLKNTNVKLEGELVVHKRLEDEIERHASQLEVANKELDAFAYSVSHDLRAPLRSINGFSTALFEDYSNKLDDQGKNYIARVRTATNRMEQLIDDLLALSRITRSTLQYADADLSRIVKDIVAEFCEREPKRKVKVKISPNITVTGDPELLQIVLFNLLDNAWKFTGKKQNPEIEFGVIEHAKRKTYFVRDNGVGFDMTYVDKLFMPFQRLHGTSEFAGTGIGLATVKRIILRHSGNVWGEGKKGRGATFYFTL